MLGRIKYQWKRLKKNHYIVIIGLISLFLIVGGFSYALFTSNTERRGTLNIVTGEIVATIEGGDLDNKHSMVIKSGESREITITLKNENERDGKFNFWYEAANGVYVYDASYNSGSEKIPTAKGMIIEKDGSRSYKLTVTNNTDREQEVTFGSNGGLYNKELMFPNNKRKIEVLIPSIDDNMIKVVYNEKESIWETAKDNNWYDYEKGKWANAVTVTSATRDKYQHAASGTVIPMDDIETMWVWIPRYSYTIGSEDGENYYGKKGEYLNSAPTRELPGEIDIKFISKDVKEMGIARYKVIEGVGNFRTPDAFTFGDEELRGVWIGKFETSSSSPTSENGGGNVTNLDAIIKPNITSWRYIQVASIAEVGINITRNGNRYGFSNERINSHAMKNSEWALAAYLSQSKYGKLGNRDYTGANKEVYPNKSDKYITGCSYGSTSNDNTDYGCQYTYDIGLEGTGASTTGTIYGIYDMSGGAREYNMANYAPNGNKYSGYNSNLNSGYSGLLQNGSSYIEKNFLEDKYYNFYSSDNLLTACNGKTCLSHALNETEGWYGNKSILPTPINPWIVRGDSLQMGIFSFHSVYGSTGTSITFRLVLSVD